MFETLVAGTPASDRLAAVELQIYNRSEFYWGWWRAGRISLVERVAHGNQGGRGLE